MSRGHAESGPEQAKAKAKAAAKAAASAAADKAVAARAEREARRRSHGHGPGPGPSFPWVWGRPERGQARRGNRQPRSREEVVATAIYLADTEGFDAVTMRRVAAELGLGTMSLYWYVESRDDLLDLMFDEIMGEQLLPEPVPTEWREALTAIAQAGHRVHHRHPWIGSRIGDRPGVSPNMLRHVEQSMTAVAGLHLEPRDAMVVLGTVDDFVIGHMTRTLARRSVEEKLGFDQQDWMAAIMPWLESMLETGDFPRLAELASSPTWFEVMQDDTFAAGLELVLDGIALRYG